MRGVRVMFVMAALCLAVTARAEPRVCLEWAWVADDGGIPPFPGPVWLMEDPESDIGVEPDAGGVEVPPPPKMAKVCTRMGWRDDGTGCSAAVGLPLAGAALALLVLVARRPRRGSRGGA